MSSEDDRGRLDLSRRKLLGSVATLGAAGAIGGAGTMAFFSDTEEFANNQLTAGELDLKVDWEEHYSDWSADESEGLVNDVEMADPGDGYIGLPDPADPLIWVAAEDLGTFMDNTSIEAYPDTNDDGIQDPFSDTTNGVTVGDFCEDGADMSEDLDPSSGLRTYKEAGNVPRGEATVDETGAPLPLVNIADVKPGDFGEVTFSFHLCDNPGYVWLDGELVDASENGITEPEAEDDDEEESEARPASQDSDSDTVELLDEIQTVWWYDDGDNVIDGGAAGASQQVDIAFLFDRSGSMADDATFLENNITQLQTDINNSGLDAQYALVPYQGSATVRNDIGDALNFNFTISGGTENASTAIIHALDNVNWRPGSKKVLVVLTDEDDDNNQATRTNALNKVDAEDACLLAVSPDQAGSSQLKTMSMQVNCGSWSDIGAGVSQQTIEDLIGFVQSVAGEEVFFRGSLRESLGALSGGNGIPLDGNSSTAFDEITGADDSDLRECFMPGVPYYVGFAWYLPVNHGNEVQGDSVSFDLGFYTEQCRHNTGAGMANQSG